MKKKVLITDDNIPSVTHILPTKNGETPTPKTYLQQLFEGKDILVARPSDMPYEVYKIIRKQQSNALKALIKHTK